MWHSRNHAAPHPRTRRTIRTVRLRRISEHSERERSVGMAFTNQTPPDTPVDHRNPFRPPNHDPKGPFVLPYLYTAYKEPANYDVQTTRVN